MVVQARSFIRERINGEEHLKETLSFIIKKGETASGDVIGLKVNEERNTMVAFIIPLPNPFPELPLVSTKYDYRPPRDDDPVLR
jgi:hypothetical protein